MLSWLTKYADEKPNMKHLTCGYIIKLQTQAVKLCALIKTIPKVH